MNGRTKIVCILLISGLSSSKRGRLWKQYLPRLFWLCQRIKSQEKSKDLRIKLQESRFKFQESRFKNNQDQDSRLKIQETREDSIKISTKNFLKTMSSTRSFHKIITKDFYSLVIDYQKVVINYQCFKMLRFQISTVLNHFKLVSQYL